MKLTILGCHSATPHADKATTHNCCQPKTSFLIDCGEGAQVLLRKESSNLHTLNIFLFPTFMVTTFMDYLD